MLTPETGKARLGTLTVERARERPSRTYRVDWAAGRVLGMTDGQEAMVQAVRKLLWTERFAYLIYSWDYGMEWNAVLGKSRAVVESELARLLREALEQDERISSVEEVHVMWTDRRSCRVTCTVETIFGTVREEVDADV